MTTETKVEAVAWIDPQGYLIDNGRFQSRVDGMLDFGDLSAYQPLYPASAITALKGEVERLRDTLTAIRQYGSDTLSGRADGGADDREWQRDAVREMTKRARVGLGIKLPGEE